MSSSHQICKHNVVCYWKDSRFVGCEKCLARGRLALPRASPLKTQTPTPTAMPNAENINPFQKSSILPRSPPGASRENKPENNAKASAQPLPDSVGGSNKGEVETILTTDPESVKGDPALNEKTKLFILQSISAVKSLHDENILAKNFIQEQKALMDKIQAEIKELKLNKSQPQVAGGSKNKGKTFVTVNKEIPQQNGGKFGALLLDAETDDDFSSGDWPNYNSDPEYQDQRRTAAKKVKKTTKRKRKQDQSSPDSKDASGSGADVQATQDKSNNSKPGDKSNTSNPNDRSPKILPPPPIKVVGIKDYQEIKRLLKEASDKEEYVLKFLGSETWKVNPSNDETFRKISEKLNEREVQWYSHSNKNTRNIKVVCKGLPPSIPEDEIVSDLLSKNFKIKSAVCMRKRVEKQQKKNEKTIMPMDTDPESATPPQTTPSVTTSENQTTNAKPIKEFELIKIPVHQLDFDHSESIENIYKIKAIAHTIVQIEPMKIDNKIVPQCRRCQCFSHTHNFCRKNPRCVKCAGKHLSPECPFKGRILNPKCVNCGAIGHPASYRGCPFAKEFQVARKKQLQAKKNSPDQKSFPKLGKNITTHAPPKKLDRTFAQALSGNTANPATQGAGDSSAALIGVLLQTIETLNAQLRVLTEKVSKLEASQKR